MEMGLLPQHMEWPTGWAWHRWHRHRSGGKRSGNCFGSSWPLIKMSWNVTLLQAGNRSRK